MPVEGRLSPEEAYRPVIDVARLTADLGAEQAELDTILEGLSPVAWDRPTPAPGWTVRHQVAHLAYFDRVAELALTSSELFARERAEADEDSLSYSARVLEPLVEQSPSALLTTWRQTRARLLAACVAAPPDRRWPWFGPSMSLPSMITARLMETWAHGQDVVDALDVSRTPTDRLRHVVHIAFGARAYSYQVRGLDQPSADVRVELSSPSGEPWIFGPEGTDQVIRGTALDFALVMTRRRHRDDTDLTALGAVASEWLTIGQAFAGPPGAGRRPGQFSSR